MLLLFGQNGQVSREILHQAKQEGVDLASYSSEMANFTDPDRVEEILSGIPFGSVVINSAAYTQVDNAESDETTAMQVNAFTPGLIARICCQRKCKLIHISTDYVFSGDKRGAYLEEDVVGPLGVYGKSKLLGEEEVLKNLKQSLILRTSWVFSGHGKNFVKTMVRLGAERGELSVVNDQVGGPTPAHSIAKTCLDLARKVQVISEASELWGIYHYSGDPEVTWYEFAQTIFQLTNQKVKVKPILTSQYPTPARRPVNSVLNCAKIKRMFGIEQPSWKQGLSRILTELGFRDQGEMQLPGKASGGVLV